MSNAMARFALLLAFLCVPLAAQAHDSDDATRRLV